MAKKDKNGHWIDPQGAAIPPKYISGMDKKRDRAVERIVAQAEKVSAQLAKLKAMAFDGVEKYMVELESSYGVNARTKEGNKCLADFSNCIKVDIKVNKLIEFDERLLLAKTIIDGCIQRWCEGSDDKIKLLVDQAFQVDKQGALDKSRILSLRKLKITDADWKKAMEIISDSIKVYDRRAYVRFLVKDAAGNWTTLPMSLSDV